MPAIILLFHVVQRLRVDFEVDWVFETVLLCKYVLDAGEG